jgi:hypothetical protein
MRGVWLLLLVGCTSSEVKDPVDIGDGVGEDTDTDASVIDTDTAVVDTDPPMETGLDPVDTDTGLGDGMVWHHVLDDISLLPAGQGFDIDGDGVVDNALGTLEVAVNALIAANYFEQDRLGVVQAWDVEDGNDLADIGLLTVRDVDDDLTDNFTGTEDFRAVASSIRPDGHALLYAAATVDPGNASYDVVLPQGQFTVGQFIIPTAAPIQVSGTVNNSVHTGSLGSGVLLTDIEAMLAPFGLDTLIALIEPSADLDLDGDGINEAISAAFSFHGVPCTVSTPP